MFESAPADIGAEKYNVRLSLVVLSSEGEISTPYNSSPLKGEDRGEGEIDSLGQGSSLSVKQ